MSEDRHRTLMYIGEADIARCLVLPDGVRVTGVHADFERMSIVVSLEGDSLPTCANGAEPVHTWGEWVGVIRPQSGRR